MNEFRARSLSHLAFPYLLCDATYVKARVGGRVVSRAVVVATAVAQDASREVLGIAIGDSEDAAFWTEFLQSLRERGLHGVQLVISDSHLGLKAAIAKVFPGASWQRCRVQPAQRPREGPEESPADGGCDGEDDLRPARRWPRRASAKGGGGHHEAPVRRHE